MNEDTKEIVNRGKALQDMVQSDGWRIARKKIIDKMMELQSIMNLDAENAEQILVETKSRVMAIDCLKGWLTEIEGDVEQFENNYQEDDYGYIQRD